MLFQLLEVFLFLDKVTRIAGTVEKYWRGRKKMAEWSYAETESQASKTTERDIEESGEEETSRRNFKISVLIVQLRDNNLK